jgi:hypothetical protein
MMKRNVRFVVFAVVMIALMVTLTFIPASAQLSQWRSLNPTRDGTPSGLQIPVPHLYGVQILNANYGWAVGGNCTIYTGTPTCTGTSSQGLALFWDGSKWRQTLLPANAHTLTAVSIVTPNDVWAVGVNSTIIHWDGVSWVTPTVLPVGLTDSLFSVFMLPGGLDGWAVGQDAAGNAIILRWSGAWPTGAWSAVVPPVTALGLRGVALSSSIQGWVVGRGGTILKWDGAGWTLITPSPTTSDLFSVSIVGASDAWAVGASSTIIHWNGASWTGPMVAPTISIDYHAIQMISASYGWIAGKLNNGEGLLLRWDGTAWSSPIRSYVTVSLNSISFMSGGALGVSVGDAETIIYWNGSSWFAQTSPTFTGINDVYLVSSNDGWAVGRNGTIFRWNGQSWNYYQTLPSSGVSLNGLFMRTSTDAWAVGNATNSLNPPTILRWNGVTWSVLTPPGVALGQNLTDVFMLSATEGWAVGTGSSSASAVTLKWDGTLWASVPSGTPTNSQLQSVHMLSSTDGWAVGYNATTGIIGPIIVRWNGLAWSPVTAPPSIGGLRSVHFLSANNGWAVGDSGADGRATIIHWDGAQWTRVSAPVGRLTSVYMVSANDGWAVGQATTGVLSLIVHWDGLTWDLVGTTPIPSSMSVTLRSVFMVTSFDGWIVGDQGLILHYGPEVIPATTTSTSTVIVTSTSTSTTTSTTSTSTSTTTNSSTTTSTTTTTSIPPSPIPGFPTESILAGLFAGLIALTIIRRRRRL